MDLRIQNMESLASHGNIPGRKAMLEILEAGLEASDPYASAKELIRIDSGRLIIGKKEFESAGAPVSGDEVINLDEINNIYVFGAGKAEYNVNGRFPNPERPFGDPTMGVRTNANKT